MHSALCVHSLIIPADQLYRPPLPLSERDVEFTVVRDSKVLWLRSEDVRSWVEGIWQFSIPAPKRAGPSCTFPTLFLPDFRSLMSLAQVQISNRILETNRSPHAFTPGRQVLAVRHNILKVSIWFKGCLRLAFTSKKPGTLRSLFSFQQQLATLAVSVCSYKGPGDLTLDSQILLTVTKFNRGDLNLFPVEAPNQSQANALNR